MDIIIFYSYSYIIIIYTCIIILILSFIICMLPSKLVIYCEILHFLANFI